MKHVGAPRPVAARHGERDVLQIGRGQRRHVLELAEQRLCNPGQGGELVVAGEIECFAQAAHRRQAEGRRPHEGVELQQVARRQRIEAEPRRRRRAVHDQRKAAGRTQRRFGRRQPLNLAVRAQPERAACGGQQGGHGSP